MAPPRGRWYVHGVIVEGLCFECGKVADFNHHVVPETKGGTSTVPLCGECHGKVHGEDTLNLRKLQREGIERAKAAGKYKYEHKRPGPKKGDPAIVKILWEKRIPIKDIMSQLGLGRNTVYRYLYRAGCLVKPNGCKVQLP